MQALLSLLNSLNPLNPRREWQSSARKEVSDIQGLTLSSIECSMTSTLRQIVANVGNTNSKGN